jgi:tetratricopeptide (TPR) repeat protein
VDLTAVHETGTGVGDTVVVCRPDQLREAAIVVSCLPADRLTPVVTVEPPPIPEAEYIALYELMRESQDGVQQTVGTALGRAEVYSGGQEAVKRVVTGMDTTDGLRELVAPYRSWLKRNELIASLLTGLGIQRAVFLDDFAPEELNAIEPALLAKWHRGQAALLGEAYVPDRAGEQLFDSVPVRLRLPCSDLARLTSSAWRLLRDPDGAPERVIEVAAGEPGGYVAALFTALRTGAALRAVERPDTESGPAFPAADSDAAEAVLVENTGHPDSLLGAIYAHHRGARLVITPQPDLEPVRAAVAEQQRQVSAAARSIGEEARGPAFVDALWRVLSAGGLNPFAAVENAVTAQITPSAVAEVGGRSLTAFTTGLPYSFVRTGTADWSRKPIGHVAADAVLIILNELYDAEVPRPAAAFSLVFDPGFFRVSETDDVMRAVGAHLTHPILLSGQDATMSALRDLPKSLPVELIFFNTHGSDDSIVLGDMPLRNSLIPQWLTFGHRPIVFNNSCHSWTGVGREFIRVGARGYIGTLWDIRSDLAADFARVVVDRLTAQEMAACEAIVDTGLRAGIERSYLYVGTAAGRLGRWHDRAATGGETALAACAILADAARDSGRAARVLHREITALRRAVEGTPQERTAAYVDTLLSELGLLTGHRTDPAGDRALEGELAERIDEALSGLDLPQETVDRRWAHRFHLTGILRWQRDEWAAALADFGRSTGYGEACETRATLLLQMAQIHMQLGDWEQAQRLARSSHDLCEEQRDTDGLMRAIGMLGQLSKRLERYGEAMAYAEEGYTRAVALEDGGRQAAFKLDQSSLHLVQGDVAAAIDAATRALELSRLDHDERTELTALGRLGICHRTNGDLDAAERYAVQGLAQARSIGVPFELVSFAFDLGELLTSREQHAEALGHYREAVAVAVDIGAWDIGAGALARLVESAHRLRDAEALWSAAVGGSHICLRSADQRLRLRILPIVVDALKTAVRTGPVDVTARGLSELVPAAVPSDDAERPDDVRFLTDVVVLVGKWLTGRDTAQLGAFARVLDGQSGGALGLAELVAHPYSPPAPAAPDDGRGRRRWRRG